MRVPLRRRMIRKHGRSPVDIYHSFFAVRHEPRQSILQRKGAQTSRIARLHLTDQLIVLVAAQRRQEVRILGIR